MYKIWNKILLQHVSGVIKNAFYKFALERSEAIPCAIIVVVHRRSAPGALQKLIQQMNSKLNTFNPDKVNIC